MQVSTIQPLTVISDATRFHPAPLATLRPNLGADFDLFLRVRVPGRYRYILFKSREYDLTREQRQHLQDREVTTLYITEEDLHKYFGYVDRAVSKVLTSEVTPPSEKSQILYETTTSLMQHMFERPDSPIILQTNQKMVAHTIDFLASDPRMLRSFVSMFAYDYSLYQHSVNVATISIALAFKLGFAAGSELNQLGYGFLFHDIGKSCLSTGIVRKPGPLTPHEMMEMQSHPQQGMTLMQDREHIEPSALDIILHHHEKISGRGYPHNLSGNEITLPMRISSVADIFDALTSHRSYKRALSGFESLKLMREQMRNDLDPDCIHVLISLLGPSH
jgi:putative nucleotidyltransferase with HDIG domain